MSSYQSRRVALFAVALLPLMAGACRLVDQTTFDPKLRARLNAPPPSKPAIPLSKTLGPPPLLTIGFAHPADYERELRLAAAEAIARKPDVRFTVSTIVPATGSLDDQIAAIAKFGGDARRVAADLQRDGVDPGQIELGAQAEPGVTGHEVRVYVR